MGPCLDCCTALEGAHGTLGFEQSWLQLFCLQYSSPAVASPALQPLLPCPSHHLCLNAAGCPMSWHPPPSLAWESCGPSQWTRLTSDLMCGPSHLRSARAARGPSCQRKSSFSWLLAPFLKLAALHHLGQHFAAMSILPTFQSHKHISKTVPKCMPFLNEQFYCLSFPQTCTDFCCSALPHTCTGSSLSFSNSSL